jgi:hypothetical protein
LHATIRCLLLLAIAAVFAAAFSGPSSTASPPRLPAARQAPDFSPLISQLRRQTWHLQALMGRPRSHGTADDPIQRLAFWRQTAVAVTLQAANPPHRRAWLCIHRYEGRWGDDGDPYWGGLQMDRGFMWHYAPRFLLRRGLANRWTPVEQMWVAERAFREGRGFFPWPNTARTCGLI